MILVRPSDVRHKTQLLRLLTKIADNIFLSQHLYFKGGTCASMLGYLDRFSVDLDFDLDSKANVSAINKEFKKVFSELDLKIDQQSQKVPDYYLKYMAPANERNTLKIDAFGPIYKASVYKAVRLIEIDRTLNCQTIETMFANKLVAPIDRFKRNGSIAGRDIYDIHHFFYQGYSYEPAIIFERTKLPPKKYFEKLLNFVEKRITETTIDEDLNALLLPEKFQKIRKILKTETLAFLRNELTRVEPL